mmetsp:Transcript_26560/g.85977  ORF Transcript_26560/g.85977 Transcript_26560/m.85977 type:complete len:229 (-) Transcript_26560:730-1416(-)
MLLLLLLPLLVLRPWRGLHRRCRSLQRCAMHVHGSGKAARVERRGAHQLRRRSAAASELTHRLRELRLRLREAVQAVEALGVGAEEPRRGGRRRAAHPQHRRRLRLGRGAGEARTDLRRRRAQAACRAYAPGALQGGGGAAAGSAVGLRRRRARRTARRLEGLGWRCRVRREVRGMLVPRSGLLQEGIGWRAPLRQAHVQCLARLRCQRRLPRRKAATTQRRRRRPAG